MARRFASLLASIVLALSTQLLLLAPVGAVDANGAIALTTVDPAGQVLVGGCFELYTDAGGGTLGKLVENGKRCDQPIRDGGTVNDGLVDGTVSFTALAPGSYIVHQTLGVALAGTSARYELAPDTALTSTAGAVTTRQLVFRPTGGLTIHKVDAAGKALPGACFTLTAPDGRKQGLCDGPHPDAGPADAIADGLLVWPGLTPTGAPTTYTLTEIIAPAGYAPGSSQKVTVDPITPTELTLRNTLGPAQPAPAASGQPNGPMVVTEVDLEIDSTIEIRGLQGMPGKGTATAKGVVPLTRSAGGTWAGTGILESTTNASYGTSCVINTISGNGTYDWVVRDAHVGTDEKLSVGMDNGPTNESPDSVATDACGSASASTMNTWENLFFDAYRPNYMENGGFRITEWTIIDPGAWTAGGPVAEARWTGECTGGGIAIPGSSIKLLDCVDTTTFRLIVRVGPAPAGASGGPGPDTTPDAGGPLGTPDATMPDGGLPAAGPAPSCDDVMSCLGQYWLFALAGGIIALGGGFLLLQRVLGGSPSTLTEPTLDASKVGPISESLQTDTLGKIEPIDASKVGPISESLQTDTLGKIEPIDADKFGTLDTSLSADTLGKLEPIDANKVGPISESLQTDMLGKIEPLGDGTIKLDGPRTSSERISTDLPPPPGSIG